MEPDYILYPDAETKERVIDKSAAERYRASVAILEAKKVNHPLSKISKHQQRYPHQQIRDYLNEAQVLARREYTLLLQEDLAAFDGSTWNVRLDSNSARLVRKLVAESKRLSNLAFVKRGLISGNRNKYLAREKKGPKWLLIATGTDAQRYGIETPAEYVLFEKPRRTAGGCWDEAVHLNRGKILLKQVGRWPQAAVDDAPYCITGNVFAVALKDSSLSPYYVTAIPNSRLTEVVWSLVLSDFKAVFPELKGEWIEQWPIRRIAREAQISFTIPLIDQIDYWLFGSAEKSNFAGDNSVD